MAILDHFIFSKAHGSHALENSPSLARSGWFAKRRPTILCNRRTLSTSCHARSSVSSPNRDRSGLRPEKNNLFFQAFQIGSAISSKAAMVSAIPALNKFFISSIDRKKRCDGWSFRDHCSARLRHQGGFPTPLSPGMIISLFAETPIKKSLRCFCNLMNMKRFGNFLPCISYVWLCSLSLLVLICFCKYRLIPDSYILHYTSISIY